MMRAVRAAGLDRAVGARPQRNSPQARRSSTARARPFAGFPPLSLALRVSYARTRAEGRRGAG
jgi:hypothetical protein